MLRSIFVVRDTPNFISSRELVELVTVEFMTVDFMTVEFMTVELFVMD